jgi:hypothetical protein
VKHLDIALLARPPWLYELLLRNIFVVTLQVAGTIFTVHNSYVPFEEGPLVPSDSDELAEETSTFLRATNNDTADEIVIQDISDSAESFFN